MAAKPAEQGGGGGGGGGGESESEPVAAEPPAEPPGLGLPKKSLNDMLHGADLLPKTGAPSTSRDAAASTQARPNLFDSDSDSDD